ncbi:MAG: type ISP restriction/modification enzyme, partial [candidate division NC10 bacterium]
MLADNRVADYLRPDLWRSHSDRQVYLSSLLSHPLGGGPAATAAAFVPDLHHFKGSFGAKETIPLYRDRDATVPNLAPGLLDLLSETYAREVTAESFLAYAFGVLAHPRFTDTYSAELETRELRVPITKDANLFEKVRALGARVVCMHTYGEGFVPNGKQRGRVPQGSARCTKAVPDRPDSYPERFYFVEESNTLRVGEGEFAPASREVFEFEVSGLKVVQSWLKYRMKQGAGKKSSPLDDIRPERWTSQFTTELLEMLWVLEATVAGYPEQAALLNAVVEGECFLASELKRVPEELRKP